MPLYPLTIQPFRQYLSKSIKALCIRGSKKNGYILNFKRSITPFLCNLDKKGADGVRPCYPHGQQLMLRGSALFVIEDHADNNVIDFGSQHDLLIRHNEG